MLKWAGFNPSGSIKLTGSFRTMFRSHFFAHRSNLNNTKCFHQRFNFVKEQFLTKNQIFITIVFDHLLIFFIQDLQGVCKGKAVKIKINTDMIFFLFNWYTFQLIRWYTFDLKYTKVQVLCVIPPCPQGS